MGISFGSVNSILRKYKHVPDFLNCFPNFALPAKCGLEFLAKKIDFHIPTLFTRFSAMLLFLVPKQTPDDKGKISDISTIKAELYAAFSKFETWIS